jgi:hypothetical protein
MYDRESKMDFAKYYQVPVLHSYRKERRKQ